MKSISINYSNVKAETDNTILIKMPNNSSYAGYSFWHPSKLTRGGIHSSSLTLSYFKGFQFNLKKYGKGKHNKYKVIEEETIDVDEFEEAFDVIDENIREKKEKIRVVPKLGEPDVSIIDDLLDD